MSLRASEVHAGDQISAVVVEDLSRTQIVQYAGASGDFNPLHTDERFATEVAGYDSVFAHGMLTMAMTGRVLTDWIGDGRLLNYSARFKTQVWPGDTLTATAVVDTVTETDEGIVAQIAVSTVNSEGAEVLSGTAVARLAS